MRRTLIEVLHVAGGVIGTAVLASLAAWSVPRATQSIWQVAVVAMVVVAGMGFGPLRRAWRADRSEPRS